MIRRKCVVTPSCCALAVALAATGMASANLRAQQAPSIQQSDSARPLFRRGDAVFIGSALATIAATTLVDSRVATASQTPGATRDRLHAVTTLGHTVGDIYPVEFVLGFWATGLVARKPVVERLGRESVEALLIAGVTTQLLKGTFGRQRPSSAAGDADNYVLGRGFGNDSFSSFPSGHTSVAFSIATVMAVGTAHQSPLVHRTVSIVAYGVATSVGLSRIYDNDHWASDVLGGAVIGVTSGLVALRVDHRLGGKPHRASTMLLDHVSIAPGPRGGISLGYTAH